MNALELADMLDGLADGTVDPPYRKRGICAYLLFYAIDDALCCKVKNLMTEWPDGSGSRIYPVPHPKLSSRNAYYSERDLWSGEYGENRRNLCRYLAKRLRESVGSGEL